VQWINQNGPARKSGQHAGSPLEGVIQGITRAGWRILDPFKEEALERQERLLLHAFVAMVSEYFVWDYNQ
jgi:hypothetical protein